MSKKTSVIKAVSVGDLDDFIFGDEVPYTSEK